MRLVVCISLLAAVVVLSGCGGGSGAFVAAPTVHATTGAGDPSGAGDNWYLKGSVGTREIGAALRVDQSSLSGYVHVFDNGDKCFFPDDVSAVNAVVQQDGTFQMSAPLSPGIVTVSGTFDSSRSSFVGTYSFSQGACANGESGTIVGTKMTPVQGTYNGTLLAMGSSTSLSANLMQSPAIDGGFMKVTGTVAYTSPTCSKQFNIVDSHLSGHFLELFLLVDSKTTTTLYGNVSDDATQLTLSDVDGLCGGGGQGTLIRQ